jgi:hypothetical protein
VNKKYVLIGVEGNHDQAFISKILRKFIPVYPAKNGKLHFRLNIPTILMSQIQTTEFIF